MHVTYVNQTKQIEISAALLRQKRFIGGVLNSVKNVAKDVGSSVKNNAAINAVGNTAKDSANKAQDGVKSAAGSVADTAVAAGNGIQDTAVAVGNGVQDAAQATGDFAKDTFDKSKAGVLKHLGPNGTLVNGVKDAYNAVADAVPDIPHLLQRGLNWFRGIYNSIKMYAIFFLLIVLIPIAVYVSRPLLECWAWTTKIIYKSMKRSPPTTVAKLTISTPGNRCCKSCGTDVDFGDTLDIIRAPSTPTTARDFF